MDSDLPPPYSPSPSSSQPRLPSLSSRTPSQKHRPLQPANQHPQPRSPSTRTLAPGVPRRASSGSGYPSPASSGSGYPSPVSRANSNAVVNSRVDLTCATRRRIAAETVAAMAEGIYSARGRSFNLRRRIKDMTEGVRYYAPQERIPASFAKSKRETHIEIIDSTTLDAARQLEGIYRRDAAVQAAQGGKKVTLSPGQPSSSTKGSKAKSPSDIPRIGILSSASPFAPAGNFLAGDEGQELSIARASTLSAALETRTALPFYHTAVCPIGKGDVKFLAQTVYHTHAMIYAPGVSVIRDEQGEWTLPMAVDVITCTAVHAGDARAAASHFYSSLTSSRQSAAAVEAEIERITTERLTRVLGVFASHSVYTLVLPAFGAGTFQNNIESIARIYAALLLGPKAPFAGVFDRVIFSIMPENQWREFESAFWGAAPLAKPRKQHREVLKSDEQGQRPIQRAMSSTILDARSTQGGKAPSVIASLLRRSPRKLDDGASVHDRQLSLESLNLEDDQDGRASIMSKRDGGSSGASGSRRIPESCARVEEDGAELEYV